MSLVANPLLVRPELGRLNRGALSLEAAAPRGFFDGMLVPGAREVG
jgi:hypothetical protein